MIMLKELDLVITNSDINDEIKKDSIGVVLSISNDGKNYLVEFVDKNNNTIGNGMTIVNEQQVRLFGQYWFFM